VKRTYRNSSRFNAVLISCSLLAGLASAQPPQSTGSATANPAVALAPDTCPTVRPGGEVTLDWNPAFEHPGAVEGLANFSLGFAAVSDDEVHLQLAKRFVLRELASGHHFSSIGNGYFHIAMTVPMRVAPGEYHITSAQSLALTSADYQGSPLWMTNSPVDARLCIKIVPATVGSHGSVE
jgi:hypothetical protein